jgi:hypothetical protein
VFDHILLGDFVRDSLVAEGGHEPVEDGRGAASGHGTFQPPLPGFRVDIVEEGY